MITNHRIMPISEIYLVSSPLFTYCNPIAVQEFSTSYGGVYIYYDIKCLLLSYCVLCSGHAKGLSPLAGEHIEFCNHNNRQIYNDPEVGKYINYMNIFGSLN